ncbi:polysaccharide biosynthesis tyrosine autokinase [Caballeronia sp. SEWSISQ10-4 2]|uniref:polysaccharide biosynthesis tyrosine autokinase n=1 Tax=Caballeronia sp. SEWSISQ10-4 2 TaxID=2937438 RepID=UPI0026548918|nr:polysaccharide biosynthesis tyrosine autokinase [Caballeronia sp. SEWSISQ10-4 2]MDN7183077.1 polysaccharide biosynthesis tyrosine autokinase [Caballeronia sp. SEWSISQ10-4 2]
MDYFPSHSLSPPIANEHGQLTGKEMLNLMHDHLWEILNVIGIVVALAVAYLLVATPIYSADVLVRVDPPEQNALGIAIQNQETLPPPAPAPSAEMAVMRSRSVLEPVIERYRFDVSVKPRTIPLLGDLAERLATPGQLAAPWLGLKSYAWGGERLQIANLDVPQELEEEKLNMVVLDGGQYELRGPSNEVLLRGAVGKPANSNGVSMLVAQLVARPGTSFEVIRWNSLDAVKRFGDVIKVTDKVKDSGLIEMEYSDSNRAKAVEVTNALAQQYLATAVASRQSNDSKTLAFINGELPRLLADLRRKEEALRNFRASSNSMQPTAEAQAYLQGGIDFDRQIATLQLQRTQMMEKFTPDSRWVQNIDIQLAQLNKAKAAFDGRFSAMPSSERNSVDLARDAKVAETIYMGMVQKAEQLSVRRASTTGGAHVVDVAIRPLRPTKPSRPIVLGGAVALGLISGMFLVFMRRHVMTGVTDPLFVERRLSVPVIGEILFSQQQVQLARDADGAARKALPTSPFWRDSLEDHPFDSNAAATALDGVGTKVLAARFPNDPSVEALREVRTALARDLVHAPNNIVMFTGPTPSAGKSFVAANLAVLHAEIGSKVLLIDADMRRGHLASYFGMSNRGGLSEVLSGRIPVRNALRHVGVHGMSFLACGERPNNPAALLMKKTFRDLLDRLSKQFDLIIIDTPPILAVTDASIIASEAGATMLVLRSGMQSEDEIADTVKKLERTEGRIAGAVFNAIPLRRSNRNYEYTTNYASDTGHLSSAS